MSHTPGPWTVRVNKTRYPGLNTYTVLGVNTTPDSVYSGEHFTVASELDSEADARLIAAAPDLLAALRVMLEWQNDEEMFSAADAARVAIAHATGTETPVRG